MDTIKINKLEIENVKRVKAVKIEPNSNGLTIVGGKNGQGKTSVIDSIAWALGGEKFRPSSATREGSVIPPTLHIVLSNGLVVERKGKNSDLKVTDPTGQKAGQQLLNEFVEQLALDLPRFVQAGSREKAEILLKIIGVGDKLTELDKQEKELYNRRLTIGQIADQKAKFAKEQPYYKDAPKELVSASELIRQQQEILTRNGENNKKRQNLKFIQDQRQRLIEQENELIARLAEVRQKLELNSKDLEIAEKSALDLYDESTAELEQNIANIEQINRKVRANLDKDKAEEDALQYKNQYNALSTQIENIRRSKIDLLKNANLPLPGLSVVDGELTYNDKKWDCMSGSEQLKVSTAIVRKLNPKCGFVLMDKLEQMDLDTLKEFGQWLEQEGLQVIATRVSTGEECSIIIEDGYSESEKPRESIIDNSQKWKAGEF
ncbi:AAA family ATPase [Ruminiclostridium cellulolyticum]|uniref:SMC domain protein n=1 Tax=Ruminiclostridium cellulolyticum (strain ATCC 35319 / DSM 5812 / JCM 6584 / H10) TaxID=394503 RepID=B8I143_RUMCH|nr:AAA family ATPase [Ruminiclostridium cellulolyticum]ACL77599.1 SMC domain protein [Ruminiclostridium cellulolyticum H10]